MKLYNESFEDEIRAEAHEIYERSGKSEGRDLDNWLEAEQIVLVRHAEYISQEDEDEAFRSMLFEGSEC